MSSDFEDIDTDSRGFGQGNSLDYFRLSSISLPGNDLQVPRKPGKKKLTVECEQDLFDWIETVSPVLPDEPGRRGAKGKMGRYVREVLAAHRAGTQFDPAALLEDHVIMGRFLAGLPPEIRLSAVLNAEAVAAYLGERSMREALQSIALRMASGSETAAHSERKPKGAGKSRTD